MKMLIANAESDCEDLLGLLLLSAGLLDKTKGSYCEDLLWLADEEELLGDVDNEQFELQISGVLELAGAAWLEAVSPNTGGYGRWIVCGLIFI